MVIPWRQYLGQETCHSKLHFSLQTRNWKTFSIFFLRMFFIQIRCIFSIFFCNKIPENLNCICNIDYKNFASKANSTENTFFSWADTKNFRESIFNIFHALFHVTHFYFWSYILTQQSFHFLLFHVNSIFIDGLLILSFAKVLLYVSSEKYICCSA